MASTARPRPVVVVGADHAGRLLQERVLRAIREAGGEPLCLTDGEPTPDFEYPEIAQAVSAAILEGRAERGVLICGSGVGMAIAANKLRGIRAGGASDTYTAHQMVEHDDVNVLALGSRVVGTELAAEIVGSFLNARFSGDERHMRRLAKLARLESEQKEIDP
jgi:ribose 5-phosphate isomerase B